MTVTLANVEFINDYFSMTLPDGSLLALNKVDEDFLSDSNECIVKAINIEVQKEGEFISCPCVIGLGNEIMQINTEHKEYEGEVLTPDNMGYCTIEVYE